MPHRPTFRLDYTATVKEDSTTTNSMLLFIYCNFTMQCSITVHTVSQTSTIASVDEAEASNQTEVREEEEVG